MGDLEITPVSAAIARHLGIDLSPEGRAARNRRGIAIIVHGPPISGKFSCNVVEITFECFEKKSFKIFCFSISHFNAHNLLRFSTVAIFLFKGKTNLSVQLAKTYGAARLTVDGIVMEAISNGNTPVCFFELFLNLQYSNENTPIQVHLINL